MLKSDMGTTAYVESIRHTHHFDITRQHTWHNQHGDGIDDLWHVSCGWQIFMVCISVVRAKGGGIFEKWLQVI